MYDFFNTAFEEVKKALGQNQFASGGLVLMVIGGLVAWLRGIPMQIYRWLYSRLVLTVHIQSRDPAFEWLRVWVLAKPESGRMRILELSARDDDDGGGFTVSSGKHAEQRALLTPISGLYTLRFEGRLFLLEAERRRLEGQAAHYMGANSGYERSFTLQTAFWNRKTLERLISEAYRHTVRPQESQLTLWRPDGQDWTLIERRPPRPLESLIYGQGLLETVLEDARTFLKDRSFYLEMGVPWRRGYLLHGPPGNGKSSLVAALAGALELNLCPINLSGPFMDDDKLTALMQNLPSRSAVLLEDIDAVFEGRDKPEGQASKLSFNGLLNALDGVTAQEGCLVFLTTNHFEKLDPALIRPGRCDLHLLVNNASSDQIAAMLRRFFLQIDRTLAESLAARVPCGTLSMARIQEYLLRHRGDLPGALLNWGELEGTALEKLLEGVV